MSGQVRKQLAEAASKVDGVTCLPYYVQSTEPGAAMVRLERIDYPNPFGGVCHWSLVVVLPQDMEAAERYVEDKVPSIIAAIEHLIVVTQVQPQRLGLVDGSVVLAVFINGHREQE
jgi:hypothetical protein